MSVGFNGVFPLVFARHDVVLVVLEHRKNLEVCEPLKAVGRQQRQVRVRVHFRETLQHQLRVAYRGVKSKTSENAVRLVGPERIYDIAPKLREEGNVDHHHATVAEPNERLVNVESKQLEKLLCRSRESLRPVL
jgi:hypothetical protein